MYFSFLQNINKVYAFAFIPYLVITLITLPYFVHQKVIILQQLRNVPASTIFAIDLSKVKKNLQIKSMIQNFILILYCFEAIVCLSSSIGNIYSLFGTQKGKYNVVVSTINTNTSCNLEANTVFGNVY